MSAALLISIHPKFVEKILTGEKVFEFRKTVPLRLPTHLVIYATSPIKKIVAIVEVNGAISGSPTSVWTQAGKGAGISRAYFRQYFSRRKTAYAFRLGRVFPLQTPIALSEIAPELVAPQAYLYLNGEASSQIHELLRMLARK